MMETLPDIKSADEGLVFIALLALLILHQFLNFAGKRLSEWYDHKKGNGLQGTIKDLQRAIESLEMKAADPPPFPQCHYAPDHFNQIEETHRLVKEMRDLDRKVEEGIHSGKFGCVLSREHLRIIERIGDRS